MTKATLPVLSIRLEDREVNRMHGYMGEIDAALLRDSITPIDSKGTLSLELNDYDYDITAIYYQIFYGANSSLLEEGVLNKLTEENDRKTQDLKLENVLKEGEEYLIQFHSHIYSVFYHRSYNLRSSSSFDHPSPLNIQAFRS